jgi:hypothetical protein
MTAARTYSKTYKVGQIRPSAMLYAFGIGSIVDLPKISAVVMGLDEWDIASSRPIHEPRLLQAVRDELGYQVDRLLSPPRSEEPKPGLYTKFGTPPVGVPVATFPRWLLCPLCRLLAPLSSGLFRLTHNQYRPDSTAYIHENCSRSGNKMAVPAVPARFLVACKHGHLDDFPWVSYVHGGPTDCQGPLRMLEFGVSGEASAITVKCDACPASKSLAKAFEAEGKNAMPMCRGRRPHLRDFEEGCGEQVETLLLGASNSWFPLALTTLALPTETNNLAQLVSDNWGTLEKATTLAIVAAFRQISALAGFEAYSNEEIWDEIEARRTGQETGEEISENLREPEWEFLSRADPNRNSADFRLRPVLVPPDFSRDIRQVVLAERLREVQAFIGFTRVESPVDWTFTEDIEDDLRAPISRKPATWVPAAQVRGEGIFIEFDEDALSQWEREVPVLVRSRQFRDAHRRWRLARHQEDTDESFPGMRYILLHSFSHALMRQFSLECGYGAASLKERLYSRQPGAGGDAMAGVLIYTAAPDSEGTLGGLVRLGEPKHLQRHIAQALELVQLCASDPLCSEHPVNANAATLHGAACHACLFVPETSCERGNRYLDRTVLVPTFNQSDLAFFGERTGNLQI